MQLALRVPTVHRLCGCLYDFCMMLNRLDSGGDFQQGHQGSEATVESRNSRHSWSANSCVSRTASDDADRLTVTRLPARLHALPALPCRLPLLPTCMHVGFMRLRAVDSGISLLRSQANHPGALGSPDFSLSCDTFTRTSISRRPACPAECPPRHVYACLLRYRGLTLVSVFPSGWSA